MDFNFIEGEILLIDKPLDWTSFDVIGSIRPAIRKICNTRHIKIGHAGTLDPMATGLLIVCTGVLTKRINDFQDLAKEYTGTIKLGASTPSFDLETEPDAFFPTDHIIPEDIFKAVKKLTGTYLQAPPLFSAIKIDGKRAYKFARKDKDIEIAPRLISIFDFDVVGFENSEVQFRIVCSKGTYIRAIARDLGIMLGCGGHITSLRRTRIGNFNVSAAYKVDEIRQILNKMINIRF